MQGAGLVDFKRLMSARFLFTLAVQMQAVVLGWRMYELTNDPLHLGLIGLVEAVPALSLALVAGYLVDRSRPLVVYRRVLYVSLTSGLVLLVTQLPGWHFPLQGQIVALLVSSFLTGTARAFAQPAIYATVPRIVAREDLPRASAWTATAMQVARISGPAVGGLVFGWLGGIAAAVLVSLALVGAIVAMLLVRASPEALPRAPGESIRRELLSGASFVFRHPVLLPALTLDMVSVLFGGVTALLPIFAAEILHVGPRGLGALRAAPAIGAAVMSFWLTRNDIRRGAGAWLFASVAGFGASILMFALSTSLELSVLALLLSGAFDSVSMVIRTTAVQLSSPDDMRGRISAVNSIFIGSSNELGEFESGVAAKLLGTMPAAVFGAVVCLATVGIVAWRSPTLRRLDLSTLSDASPASQ